MCKFYRNFLQVVWKNFSFDFGINITRTSHFFKNMPLNFLKFRKNYLKLRAKSSKKKDVPPFKNNYAVFPA